MIRILLHAVQDARLLEQVAGILETAVEVDPDHWDKVKDQPGIVDHYGHHTDTRSSTVLVKESWSPWYYRLTIRPGENAVYDNLAALIASTLVATPATV